MAKIVIIGAGSVSFTRGLLADLIESGEPWDLGLVDINPDALDVTAKLLQRLIDHAKAPIRLRVSVDRRELLADADVVVTTIAVGGRQAWLNDVAIPRKYGIFQSAGDTDGPGGIFRTLRMVPAMLDIARDIAELCPRALFFNYANPVAKITRAIYRDTGLTPLGMCHGAPGVAWELALWAGAKDPQSPAGLPACCAEVDWTRVAYKAIGINHLTWFYDFTIDGRDAWRTIRDALARDRAAAEADGRNWEHPFVNDLFNVFGAFPAVHDRHTAEFFPQLHGGEAYVTRLGVDRFNLERQYIEPGDREYAHMLEQAAGREPLDTGVFSRPLRYKEQMVRIVRAVRADRPGEFFVNVPNGNAVENLPPEAVIECVAGISREGVRPLPLGRIPTGIKAALQRHFDLVELAVEAATERSRAKLLQALVLEGSVKSVYQARRLIDEMLDAHRLHLPKEWFAG
ncbi:MAG: hypothetical protein GXY55_00390 [Phycisphaerae bacterium]|nr:hypothetical protein [Phycisphaerae bacterium]